MADPIKDATPAQILQIEILNQSRIYLYHRNGVWKAYEYSAFVLSRFYPDLETQQEPFGFMRPGMPCHRCSRRYPRSTHRPLSPESSPRRPHLPGV